MSNSSDRRPTLVPLTALVLLMAATRFHHFGSALNLPDASVAVFFLLGLLLSWRWFPAFALLAAGIDYVATSVAAVSDFCITPAYVFLLPTYAAMTFAGQWSRRHAALGQRNLLPLAAAGLLGATVAFVISNGSFYFFSSYFADLTFFDYVGRTSHYAIPYVGWAMAYIALGLATMKVARRIRGVDSEKVA